VQKVLLNEFGDDFLIEQPLFFKSVTSTAFVESTPKQWRIQGVGKVGHGPTSIF
jgi:hypothetical protein